MSSDEQLLVRWREGDATAGDALLRRHFDALYLFFRTKVSGPVDDLIQGTLLGLCEAQHAFRGDSSVKTFLLGIARKQLLRHFRNRHRAGKVFDPAQASVVAVSPDTSASSVMGRSDDRKLLVAALQRLPIDLQIALELHYWEGLSMADVGEVLEVPAGTVKSRLHRARRLLDDGMKSLGASESLRETTRTGLQTWAQRIRDDL